MHVSGHGKAEELRTIIGLTRPKAVMPMHGEFRMLAAHAQLARDGGVPEDRIIMAENGTVVELRDGVPKIVDTVPAGMTFVDGLGVGDVHDVALRDRQATGGGRHPHRRRDDRDRRRRGPDRAAGAHRARLRRGGGTAPRGATRRGEPRPPRPARGRRDRDQAPPGAPARSAREGRLQPHAPPPDDPAGHRRGLARVPARAAGAVHDHVRLPAGEGNRLDDAPR